MTESGAQVSREAITMATAVRCDCVTEADSWRSLTSSSLSPQLFARLEARRCLKDVEPRLFPAHGGPEHGD